MQFLMKWRIQKMDNIKRGEIFYISRGGHLAAVSSRQTVRQWWLAMTETTRTAQRSKLCI